MDFYEQLDKQDAQDQKPLEDFCDPLFQYTNIEVLSLILKNKTLRLTELSELDDKEEKNCFRAMGAESKTYVSCWTNDSKESIPMWNMYTDPKQGVRICFSVYPFSSTLFDMSHTLCEYDPSSKKLTSYNGDLQSGYFNHSIIRGKHNLPIPLYRVQYTDDSALLNPIESFRMVGGKVTCHYPVMGLFKNTYWSFQNEYRYVLSLTGNGCGKLPKCLDFSIADEAIASMRITKSPLLSAGNNELLNILLKQYNLQDHVDESDLTGRLKSK